MTCTALLNTPVSKSLLTLGVYSVNKPLSLQYNTSSSDEEDIQIAGMHKVCYYGAASEFIAKYDWYVYHYSGNPFYFKFEPHSLHMYVFILCK